LRYKEFSRNRSKNRTTMEEKSEKLIKEDKEEIKN